MMSKDKQLLDPKLKALSEATQAVTSELSLEQVLLKIAQAARTLIDARYAALGVHDGYGHLSRFITAGLDPAAHQKIGPLPTGLGLLGHFLHQGESLIVKDIAHHAAAAGFPPHHPVMNSLLGVPIFSKGELIGALYLTDKQDGSDFTETDQQLIEMLALHAAIAIENANLYEKTQRLAILEERERFARDLHDGIIQSIYGVGLILDNTKALILPENEAAQQQIDLSLKSLAAVINDLRNYIFDLRPQALKSKGLYTRLEGLIKELKVNTLLPIELEIDPEINSYITDLQASHLFHIAHEALSNAARHARPKKISLSLTRQADKLTLRVEDDGIGFEPPHTEAHGHQGLANMYKRASILNADLKIEGNSNQGTILTLTVSGISKREDAA
ncbi:MAG: GAF domain-containing sensor histidine kinase [Chloroflexi bacterium]|nr:GAF domain-containing sensor histidine kinase [Chloroflexota bacterium]